MFKKFSLIISIALGLVISGCASFDYETRPFFLGTKQKVDCTQDKNGMILRVSSKTLCDLERFGY